MEVLQAQSDEPSLLEQPPRPRRTISIISEDDSVNNNEDEEHDQFDAEPVVIPKLRQRVPIENFNSPFNGGVRRRSSISMQGLNEIRKNRIRLRWQLAAKRAKLLEDPWAEFHIIKYPAEKVVRHRYNAIQDKWIKDECTIKMEKEPFAFGAMRACYRVKKLSNSLQKTSWDKANNYVAKCFMTEDVEREKYFEDVKLQMDAKLWAERYNRHNPPKKIDMFQVTLIEFINRPDSPLYHFEHYIDGNYVKYNSNSGFVSDEIIRHTPQAFSHFTFESSNHELIIVDVQGVGDLYTDPQIHTYIGTDYGDGNLGPKGMALFFKSHVCNEICEYLGLTPFDLAESEEQKNEKYKTLMKKRTSFAVGHAFERLSMGVSKVLSPLIELRNRLNSQNSAGSDETNNSNILQELIEESEGYESANSSGLVSPNVVSSTPAAPIPGRFKRQMQRQESTCLDAPFSPTDEDFFNTKVLRNRRASCVTAEHSKIVEKPEKESILGCVHIELCKYHEMGRFATDGEPADLSAAFYHLQLAADLGNLEALKLISKIYLGLPHDILEEYELLDSENNAEIGFKYLSQAADRGDSYAISYIAKAYDTGIGLPEGMDKNWKRALELYQKIVDNFSEDSIGEDMGYSDSNEDPVYIHLARMAEMYLSGSNGIEKNSSLARDLYNQAAEKAMAYGKGKMSSKYYMLAEAIPDDEEEAEEEA